MNENHFSSCHEMPRNSSVNQFEKEKKIELFILRIFIYKKKRCLILCQKERSKKKNNNNIDNIVQYHTEKRNWPIDQKHLLFLKYLNFFKMFILVFFFLFYMFFFWLFFF